MGADDGSSGVGDDTFDGGGFSEAGHRGTGKASFWIPPEDQKQTRMGRSTTETI